MNKVYFSIVSEFPKNVIMSQVVEYLELMGKQGINFNLLFFIRVGAFLKGRKEIPGFRQRIAAKLKIRPKFIPVWRDSDGISIYIAALYLCFRFFKYRSAEKIIIHSRGLFGCRAAVICGKIYKNISFIYDIRGDVAAEYLYYAKQKGITEKEIKRELIREKAIQTAIGRQAEKVFTVSEVLKRRMIDDYNYDSEKIIVIPCLADSNIFCFSRRLRDEFRKKLDVSDKYVIVYPGAIGYWHYSDTVFQTAGGILNQFSEVFFLILTPQTNEAREYASKYLPQGRYFITSAKREEVPGYLNASDLGFLLREQHDLNRVAAPTKFAEYMMCGLPVMISEGIGDYSEYIKKKGYGIVASPKTDAHEYVQLFKNFYDKSVIFERELIAIESNELFSKQKFINLMSEVYKKA